MEIFSFPREDKEDRNEQPQDSESKILLYMEVERGWKCMKKELLFYNCENMELVEGNRDILFLFRLYIEELEKMKKEGYFTVEEYEGACNVWFGSLLELIKEAYNNLVIGNFYSYTMIGRTIIENYVCFYLIKKYKKEELWKKWYYNSLNQSVQKLKKLAPEYDGTKEACRQFEEICREQNIEDTEGREYARDYGWIESVLNVPKKKKISFKMLCENVDEEIYEDFSKLSESVHGVSIFEKIGKFTFEESFFHMASILEDYIFKVGSLYTYYLTKDFIKGHFDILEKIRKGLEIK